jgi:hypothetical protein
MIVPSMKTPISNSKMRFLMYRITNIKFFWYNPHDWYDKINDRFSDFLSLILQTYQEMPKLFDILDYLWEFRRWYKEKSSSDTSQPDVNKLPFPHVSSLEYRIDFLMMPDFSYI